MQIAVITCKDYRDAIPPFMALFERFWPGCPYPVAVHDEAHYGETWCSVVARCARDAGDDPILMMLEDFWLTEPVHPELILHGLELLKLKDAGCVRLYPSPGGTQDFGDPYYAIVPPGTVNRISCMAAIWKPAYLLKIANGSTTTTSEAGDFENLGTPFSDTLPEPVLAFRRDARPWPMEYLCSAISRGLWSQDAIKLCAEHGIDLDRSMRAVEA